MSAARPSAPGGVSRLVQSSALLPIAAAVLLVLLFFWKLAFTNLILARGDLFLYFYPYWDYRARALLAGHLPLWNPLLFMGAPFLANSQAGVLYPPNWPLAVLAAPQAIKAAIILHLAIAALGTYAFARRALGQSALGALLAAALFSLGGYLTSQIEHVNQLQGLAWLPWLLLAGHVLAQRLAAGPPGLGAALRRAAAPALAFAVILSLQILAGHTQSAFISLAGVFLYVAVLSLLQQPSFAQGTPFPLREGGRGDRSYRPSRLNLASLAFVLAAVLVAAILSVGLAAAQVLPTLELSGQSLRGGGLPLREALSFSLDPRLLGRALLPGYSRTLFSEFVAYMGLAGLALSIAGLSRRPQRLALAALAALGLGFALGGYDPVYVLLAALPPFDLFRAPARWLVLFALAAALLAGAGLDELVAASARRRVAMLLAPLALVALTPLAARLVPAGETGPLGLPQAVDLAGWLLPLGLLALLLWLPLRPGWHAPLAAALAVGELFVAGWALPYNHLTTPEAYASVRPAMTQLLAGAQETLAGVPGRFLSMSALRFDPGDLAELQSELAPQLPADAVYDAVIATKNKEVLSPNLPLAWGIPAVDGYDGGVLPLRHYSDFTSLFTGVPSVDGRLRENLTSAPDPRLLSLMNVRYLITDKVDDAWVNGVFYDRQFTLTLATGQAVPISYVPTFRANALGLLADSYSGQVQIDFSDHSRVQLPITSGLLPLPAPAVPTAITLTGPLSLRGLSLIDTRTGAFQSLALGPYRLVHSGDVKVYENLAMLPRASVAPYALVILDDSQARAALASPTFDPSATVILANAPTATPATSAITASHPATITLYAPETIQLTADGPGTLLLTDAYYPGWTATIDGVPATIYRADIMFRAVSLPPGSHHIEFRYSPTSVRAGLVVSFLAWLGLGALILLTRWPRRRRDPDA